VWMTQAGSSLRLGVETQIDVGLVAAVYPEPLLKAGSVASA
jgi:hypothetical protein